MIERAAREILPLATRLDHPRSFAFVPSSPTWPGVLADFMAAGYNINACTWLVASGPSQLELVVIDWFRRWVGYPEGTGGLFTSGGAAATLDALVAARESAGNPERPVVYMSNQSHSVIDRAAMIVGIRRDRIRRLPAGGRTGLDVDSLRDAVCKDRAAGLQPMAVCANAGTASTGAIDPLPEIAAFCAAEDVWMHVDAAYGGFAAVTEEGKTLLRGIERADSIGLDAHKWFFQPYEAGCLLVKDARTLEIPFALRHDVLQDTVWGKNHPNFADRGLPTQPLVPCTQGLDDGPGLWHGGASGSDRQRDGVGRQSRGVCRRKSGSRTAEPCVTRDRMFPSSSRVWRRPPRRINRHDQPNSAGSGLLGRQSSPVVHPNRREILAPTLHRQPLHELGGRAHDAGGRGTVWKGGGGGGPRGALGSVGYPVRRVALVRRRRRAWAALVCVFSPGPVP